MAPTGIFNQHIDKFAAQLDQHMVHHSDQMLPDWISVLKFLSIGNDGASA